MFEEFRAPAPPKLGIREFAIVAERARAIRRRRRAWTALGAVAATALLVVVASVMIRPRELAVSTDEVSPTQVQTIEREYRLDDLASIDQVARLDPEGRTLPFVAEGWRGEIFAQPDGSVCVRNLDGITPVSCAAAGASLHVAFWNDAAAPLAIFLIDNEVSVAIKSADAECLAVNRDAPVQVWACSRLDPLITTVRVLDADHVLIDTLS